MDYDTGVTSNYLNLTSNFTVDNGRNENLAKFEILVLALIFALAVAGNSMVLLVLACRSVHVCYIVKVYCFVNFFSVFISMKKHILFLWAAANFCFVT